MKETLFAYKATFEEIWYLKDSKGFNIGSFTNIDEIKNYCAGAGYRLKLEESKGTWVWINPPK